MSIATRTKVGNVQTTCTVDGCDSTKLTARGMCGPHYKRWWRHGDPTAGHRRAPDGATLDERLAYVGWNEVLRHPHLGPCYDWRGLTDQAGYGRVWDGERVVAAHRAAYTVAHGPIPHGALVRHRCDAPPCIRDEHLLLGDDASNAADMVDRGRWLGRRVLKVTPQDADRIRAGYTGRRGELADLAREYGVSPSRMWHIVKGDR